METLDTGWFTPGWLEQEGARFHHTTQNGPQFKRRKLFILKIFTSYWLLVTEFELSETTDNGGTTVYGKSLYWPHNFALNLKLFYTKSLL